LELRVCLLEVLQVVLVQPSLSSPFLFQHVKLPLQIAVFRLLVGDALVQGSQLLVTTHNRAQLLRFLLGVSDHILRNGGD
jgi:hypothetical protein